jgi:hypothetical protein
VESKSKQSNSAFEEQASQVHLHFPKLRGEKGNDGVLIVKGEVDIIDRDGTYWESFQVEIHPVDEFPFRYPSVYETGGKIPRIGDWHVYENTQTCCIDVEPEEVIKCRDGLSLVDFIRREMIPYFFAQTFRRKEGYYPNGEYEHNEHGLFQYYDRLLKTNGDPRSTVHQMRMMLRIPRPARTNDCFCGSQEKFRRCHRTAYDTIHKIGERMVVFHAEQIANLYKNR